MKNIVIRVGEKNNFNMTKPELKELDKYKNKGLIFVNSNGFTKIDSTYPSIVTINPYMKFLELKGDLSNVKAVRIKIFHTRNRKYIGEMAKCLEFCKENNLNILLTFMRYRSNKTAIKYSGNDFKNLGYEWKGNYHRPTQKTKDILIDWAKLFLSKDQQHLLHTCDSKGNGCPYCMNCSFLTYGIKNATIKALNLSISGIKDKNGKQGICSFNCPDCFAKIVTYGKSPACDKLITNQKIQGKLKG